MSAAVDKLRDAIEEFDREVSGDLSFRRVLRGLDDVDRDLQRLGDAADEGESPGQREAREAAEAAKKRAEDKDEGDKPEPPAERGESNSPKTFSEARKRSREALGVPAERSEDDRRASDSHSPKSGRRGDAAGREDT